MTTSGSNPDQNLGPTGSSDRPDDGTRSTESPPESLRSPLAAPVAGQILNNRYRLERSLGQGGMGQVFLATDLSTEEEVALKTIGGVVEAADRRRFEREIRTLQTLRHPSIVAFRDLGWAGEALYFTMDYVEGVTLEDVIQAAAPAQTPEALRWFLEIALQTSRALAYLHQRRIVHRDIKPANILLNAPGGGPENPADWLEVSDVRAFLTDFGLVKTRDTDGSMTRSAMGTPQYMSPEQIEASPAVDERSDLYSLGVVLYRIASGRFPFERLSEVLSRQPAPPIRDANPRAPELLQTVTQRLLEFEPYLRPASAEETITLLGTVLDRAPEESADPTPAKMAQPAFCGRADEVALLKAAARQAARGSGRWVSITGERGTGKTWLVSRSDLKTHCVIQETMAFYLGAFDPKRPHGGFRDVLVAVIRHLDRHQGEQAVTDALGRWGRHLRLLCPELGPWLDNCPDVDENVPPEVRDERVFETVVRVLTERAETEPRVLAFDDIHTMDDFDLELLNRLIIHCASLPVLILTTHRSEVEGRLRPLERILNERRAEDPASLTEIEVAPFGREDARAMVASLLSPARQVPDSVVDVLLDRTDGVPLYLLHFLISLWNRKLLRLTPTTWEVDPDEIRALPIPESTRSHFLLVLDELPSEDIRVLNLAATLGVQFSFDLLVEVLEMDEFELDQTCRNLVHAGILVEYQDGFRFLHSFEQEIILARLSKPMFRRLHGRVAAVLEEFYAAELEDHLGQIAEHMYLGGNQEKGLDYLRRAAHRAEQANATRTALELYVKALELTSDPVLRRQLLQKSGDLCTRLGEYEEALGRFREAIRYYTAVEEALLEKSQQHTELTPADREELVEYARLLLEFGRVYLSKSEYRDALENFEKADRIARLVEDTDTIAMALVRQGNAHVFLDDPQRAEEVYSDAVALFKTLPPSEGSVVALVGLALVERTRGNFERAIEHSNVALELAREIGDHFQTAGILNNFGIFYRARGRLQDAVVALERSIEIREQLGDRAGLARSFMNLGRAQFTLGDFRRALEALTRARELFRAIGDQRGLILTLGNLGSLEFLLGNFLTAREHFESYLSDARRLGLLRAEADALNSLGMLELEVENYASAEERLEESYHCFEKAGDREGKVENRVQLARVLGRQGRLDDTLQLIEQIHEQAGEMEVPSANAQAFRIEAETRRVLGDLETAREQGEKALDAFEKLNLPFDQGCAARTLGKVYRDMGFYWADQAGKYFERALRVFEMLGARHALAVTRVEYGILLGLLDENERARDLLTRAQSVFEDLGIATEIDRVARELKEI